MTFEKAINFLPTFGDTFHDPPRPVAPPIVLSQTQRQCCILVVVPLVLSIARSPRGAHVLGTPIGMCGPLSVVLSFSHALLRVGDAGAWEDSNTVHCRAAR
jgi:hypothetical protein